jgi:hypothetical protein
LLALCNDKSRTLKQFNMAAHGRLTDTEMVCQQQHAHTNRNCPASGAKARLYQQTGLAGFLIFLMTAGIGAYFLRRGMAAAAGSTA